MIPTSRIQALRAELLEAGVFQHHTARTTAKFFLLAGVAGGLAAIAYLGPLWLAVLASVVASVPTVAAALIGHEGSHGSYSSSPAMNAFATHIAFPLFTGLGALHWKEKHNVLHHGHPNVSGLDDDIDLWPMALTSEAYASSAPARRLFQRHFQGYLFWPLTAFLGWVMRVETLKSNIRLAPRYLKRGKARLWLTDIACQLAHYGLLVVVPGLMFGFGRALLYYIVVWSLGGVLLALIFAPAHIGLPIVSEQERGWLHQLATTRNLKLPGLVSWFFCGLDYQVEHHLFPRIPHQNLPRAREVVRAWCLEHDYPHLEESYTSALSDCTQFFFRGWKTPALIGLPGESTAPAERAAAG